MRAVVLVGGFGTRLRPLTLGTPKQMLPIVDRPMIEHVVGHLASHGIEQAILSMGYLPDGFKHAYPTGSCAGVELHYAVEPEPLDTAGAIRFAALDAGIEETFLVVNGDVLTDLDISALIEFHAGHGSEGTIALHQVEDPSAFGVVPTNSEGRVEAFVEKPAPGEAPTDWINAGSYVLEPSVLDRIADGRKVSIEREVFPAMVADQTLFASAAKSYWIDAGTPAQYLAAQLDLIDGTRKPVLVAVSTEAIVDPSAKIERSVVAAGAVIEAGVEVIDSVVLNGATVAAGARVHNSIVGPGSSVGSEASLDELCVLGEGAKADRAERLRGVRRPEHAQ